LLIDLGFPAPRKGKPVDELVSKACEWLGRHKAVTVVLDEFDQLQEQTEIAYDIHHCSEKSGVPIGLYVVSNKPPAEIELDPRCESRLGLRELEFEVYDAEKLFEILKRRAEAAFEANAYSDDAIQCIADYVGANGGDCRHALELLHTAGRIADRANNGQLTAVHAEQSLDSVRN